MYINHISKAIYRTFIEEGKFVVPELYPKKLGAGSINYGREGKYRD
jgi:hypothetical protein